MIGTGTINYRIEVEYRHRNEFRGTTELLPYIALDKGGAERKAITIVRANHKGYFPKEVTCRIYTYNGPDLIEGTVTVVNIYGTTTYNIPKSIQKVK